MRAPNPSPDRAMEILREVAAARGLTVSRIVGPCRHVETSAARKAFCILAVDNGIGTRAIADLLACDRSTVSYHLSPTAKANKTRARARTRMALKSKGSHLLAWRRLLRAVEMAER